MCAQSAATAWKVIISTSKFVTNFVQTKFHFKSFRNQLIRKQTELVQFLKLTDTKPDEFTEQEHQDVSDVKTVKEESVVVEELAEEVVDYLEEDEILEGFSEAEIETYEEIEDFEIADDQLSDDQPDDANDDVSLDSFQSEEDCNDEPKPKLAKQLQTSAPRFDEVKYEKVTPTLVLTPNFLMARDALRKLPSKSPKDSKLATYVAATLICNTEEKTVFICNDCKAEFSTEDEMKLHLVDHKFESGSQQCEYCPFVFKTRHFYDKHVERVHNESQFICQICGKIMETRIQWRSHLRNHDQTLKYKCPVNGCEKAFRVKHHLDNHSRVHSKDSPFNCTFEGCSAKFRQKHALTIHLRKHRGEFKLCSTCNSPFVTQFQLNKHIEKCDGTFKPLVTRSTPGVKKAVDEVFKCSISDCVESFRAKITLEKHLIRAHQVNVTPTMCVLCCEEFANQQLLKSHLRDHLPFTCVLCSVNFKSEENLHNHMTKSHEKDEVRLHRCNLCTAAFKRAEHLRSHVAYKHSKARPYACDSCPYMSPTRHDLNSHMKMHMNEKDFICRLCHFAAKKLATIKVHMKAAHNSDEYYFCSTCSTGFKYQNDYSQHQKDCC